MRLNTLRVLPHKFQFLHFMFPLNRINNAKTNSSSSVDVDGNPIVRTGKTIAVLPPINHFEISYASFEKVKRVFMSWF